MVRLLGMARNQVGQWSEDSKTVVLLAGGPRVSNPRPTWLSPKGRNFSALDTTTPISQRAVAIWLLVQPRTTIIRHKGLI
jgi:hypothetical protein